MINNLLKNFCLITFALIAPITLPAGGIQKSLNQDKFSHNINEIILSSNTYLYSFPEINAKELLVLDIGTCLSVLRNWKVSESEIWFRVELASNKLLDDPNKIKIIDIMFKIYIFIHPFVTLLGSPNNLLEANSTLTQISFSFTFQSRKTDKVVPTFSNNNSLAIISGKL